MGRKFVLLGDMGLDHEGFPPTPVIAGSSTVLMDGKPIARVGDPLAMHDKPKHSPHPRAVAEGEPTLLIEGKPVALTGHAVTCGGTLVGSGSGEVNGMGGGAPSSGAGSGAQTVARENPSKPEANAESQTASRASDSNAMNPPDNTVQTWGAAPADVMSTQNQNRNGSPEASALTTASAYSPPQSGAAQEKTQSDNANAVNDEEPEQKSPEPGFHVVRQPMSKNTLLQTLYGDASAKPDHFDRLNPNLDSRVLPGQMIVLGDPEGTECTQKEASLMHVASQVNQELRTLDESEAKFLADHYDLLEALTSNTATGMGAGAVMISNQIKSIESTLRDLESLHQESYRKYGHLNNGKFFEKRRALFKKLDFAMGKIVRKGMSLEDSPKMKSALGLSTKSLVHNWKQSGVGSIPGYATHYDTLARYARYAKQGGTVATLMDAGVSGMKIHEVCNQGNDEECRKVKYTEGGRFAGSFSGGMIGAKAGGALCTLVGISSAGVGGAACLIIVGGAGAAIGGSYGGDLGNRGGEEVYRYLQNE